MVLEINPSLLHPDRRSGGHTLIYHGLPHTRCTMDIHSIISVYDYMVQLHFSFNSDLSISPENAQMTFSLNSVCFHIIRGYSLPSFLLQVAGTCEAEIKAKKYGGRSSSIFYPASHFSCAMFRGFGVALFL